MFFKVDSSPLKERTHGVKMREGELYEKPDASIVNLDGGTARIDRTYTVQSSNDSKLSNLFFYVLTLQIRRID